MGNETILIGKTKLNRDVKVCCNCECYPDYPHFIYNSGRNAVAISMLEARFVDHDVNIDLKERQDIEVFLSIVNKKYDITNWEVLKMLWNQNNKIQIPKHSHKPYYRNLIEYVDYANISYGNKDISLKGARVYCSTEVEQEPHFHYELSDGTDIAISFLEAVYLEPIKRKLTDKEIENLITFLNNKMPNKCFKCTNWEFAITMWNNQNCYDDKEGIYPPCKKLKEDLKIPDYRLLNNE